MRVVGMISNIHSLLCTRVRTCTRTHYTPTVAEGFGPIEGFSSSLPAVEVAPPSARDTRWRERDQSEEGEESSKGKEEDGGEERKRGEAKIVGGHFGPGQLPSMLAGRRIRYKCVCTPPEGYVPSELDAKTLPRGFFERSKDVFSLKTSSEGLGSGILKGVGSGVRLCLYVCLCLCLCPCLCLYHCICLYVFVTVGVGVCIGVCVMCLYHVPVSMSMYVSLCVSLFVSRVNVMCLCGT